MNKIQRQYRSLEDAKKAIKAMQALDLKITLVLDGAWDVLTEERGDPVFFMAEFFMDRRPYGTEISRYSTTGQHYLMAEVDGQPERVVMIDGSSTIVVQGEE